jgi:hypothetical protein
VILTLVALGVLWLLWPWILGALGFGEEGIVEGEFPSLVPPGAGKVIVDEGSGRWLMGYSELGCAMAV